jgi:putative tryptophan/tyrosine transport system substrate-binding protein
MRKLLILLLLVVLAVPIVAQDADEDMPVIGFMQFVSHPALDAGRDGAVEVLEAAGYVDGETARFLYGNGEGDIPTLSTIANNFVDEGADLIIATSTPALQAAFAATADIGEPPVIFNVVTSPYAAGVADTACIKPGWVTGSQALAPYADTVPLIFEIVPDAESVGYIYNTAEANSVANTEIIEPLMAELGLNMEIQEVSNSSEVPTAAEALISRGVDIFYVATDSTVVAGLEGLIAVANENQVPVIASDPSSAPRGAVLAQGLDYTQEGRDAGRIAVAYLNGEIDIAETGISRQTQNLLAVNLDAAEAQGVTVPERLLEIAGMVVEGGETAMAEREMVDAEAQIEADAAFLEALFCSEERIEEQQAELDSE